MQDELFQKLDIVARYWAGPEHQLHTGARHREQCHRPANSIDSSPYASGDYRLARAGR
jgi:hypothetical protein